MTIRATTVAAVLLALVGVVVSPPAAAAGLPAQGGANPLDGARQAAERTPFRGTLSVEWVDQGGRHSTRVTVGGAGGVVHIDGGGSVVATPDERMLLQSTGWSLVGPGDPSAWGPMPPMTAKYTVVRQKGPDVAGRPTDLVAVRNQRGNTDELLYLDTATGLVLRREQFENGLPVRVVSFTQVVVGPAARESIPSVNRSQQPRQLRPQTLAAPYRAPGRLAAGYRLVGVVRRRAVVQVVYSDGLHSLSVFEQGGGLDGTRLPRAGETVTMGPVQGVRYGWPGGQLITWQSGPAIFTAVGDGPASDVLSAVSSFPPARMLSVRQRIRLTSRRLFEELTGRG